MREQIEVVYENGVLRPLAPMPMVVREHEHLIVTIEVPSADQRWLADADPTVSLETVREILSKVPGTLAQLIHEEREDRF